MKSSKLLLFLCFVFMKLNAQSQILPTVKSLKANYEAPEWFRDAKLGIYTHWGPVTEALKFEDKLNTGELGWYGMQMYLPGSKGFEYHKKYWGGTEKTGFKDIIPQFTAKNFDPEEWADLFQMAGARFAGTVSTHHDGFYMWDSEINPYNSSKMGPKRDVCGEMATALRKRGIKFIGTFHHGFTHRYYEGAWDFDGKEAPEFYGNKRERISETYINEEGFKWVKYKWQGDNDWKKIPRDYQEHWRDVVAEFVDKYEPDLLWFDFGLGWMDSDIQNQMFANFYNKAHAYGQKQPTVAHKSRRDDPLYYGTLDLERGNMPRLTSYPWLSDTSPSAWFYYPNPKMQSDDIVVDMFVDIVAKNGCMLLNVGPNHTGEIPPEFMSGLKALGAFNDICGEGIFETRPWFTYGEGITKTITGHQGAANSLAHQGSNFTTQDIRYTQSKDEKKLFAFAMDWPKNGKLTLKSVSVEEVKKNATIELFGYGVVNYKINKDKTITIDLPIKAPNPNCNGFKISNMDIKWQPLGHYLIANASRIDVSNLKRISRDEISVNFVSGSICNGSIMLGSKVDSEGVISLFDGSKKLAEVNYNVKAKETVEVGDFMLVLGRNEKTREFRMVISGIDKKDVTELAVGIQREHTILNLGEGFN
ncbi:alpha-L-fucosidase [Lutibacter citreus]|uniref:alpha-L-fucosidase n=1 Tax=Lutibacter citreus TaxID=2138210 RepID=UPI000DBE53DA|nr:alpha-L-fucosidase [Lutibacter citreus]